MCVWWDDQKTNMAGVFIDIYFLETNWNFWSYVGIRIDHRVFFWWKTKLFNRESCKRVWIFVYAVETNGSQNLNIKWQTLTWNKQKHIHRHNDMKEKQFTNDTAKIDEKHTHTYILENECSFVGKTSIDISINTINNDIDVFVGIQCTEINSSIA